MNPTTVSDIHHDADTQLLVDLVSTPSVSGSERASAERFVGHAGNRGFDTKIDQAGNAIADRGAADAPIHIVLLGHIDTVQGDIPVRLVDGVLYGRGAVDAKGPLCAMLCAAERAELPRGVRLSVIGAVGEETSGSPGARYLASRLTPNACIIGEPSGWDGVTLGYKGRLIAQATATCPNHHSAGDALSACDAAVAWWNTVTEFVDDFNTDRKGVFQTIQATLQEMHFKSDGLIQRATLEAGFRLPTGMSPGELALNIEAFTNEQITLEYSGSELAHVTDRNDPVVRALSSAIRSTGNRPRPKIKTGTADLNVVGPIWKCPIAAYGPGNSSLDHTPAEHIELGDYARSIEVLAHAVTMLAHELERVPKEANRGLTQGERGTIMTGRPR